VTNLFSLLPFIAVAAAILVMTLGKRNPVLNCTLLLMPTMTATIYPALLGQTILEVSTHGSVLDRLKYLAVILGPLILGIIGTINEIENQDRKPNSLNPNHAILVCVLLIFPVLKVYSVFQLRPVNGVGQSIYIPLSAALATIFLVVFISTDRIQVDTLRKSGEILLTFIFAFLFVNSITQILTWPEQEKIPSSSDLDSFRFSPFGSILRADSRQAFFESDPERFAMFALLAFGLVWTSESLLRKITGCLLIFIIGSSTQSRLFYLGIILIILTQICKKFFTSSSSFPRMAYLVVILSAYVFVLKEAGKISSNQLSTFNGRTYIWGIVLDHWNDDGSIFGYSGAYNLYNYSMENSVLFVIYHAHNMVLQLLWDWGIFGLVVGAIVLLVFLKTYLRVQWGGFILMTLILFEGLIEPVLSFSVQSSEMFFLLIYLKYIFAPVVLSENSKV
jgi:hypothetical protein